MCSNNFFQYCIPQKIPKKNGVSAKLRPKYIAPPPRVRRKLEKEPEEFCDNRYKIVVWTGNKANATTDANVSNKGMILILYCMTFATFFLQTS